MKKILLTIFFAIAMRSFSQNVPTATDDFATGTEDTPLLINVLDNDSVVDTSLNLSSVTIIVAPTNGTCVVDPMTGTITYTPNPNFNGTDTLTYQVYDTDIPTPNFDTAIVNVTITPVNDAPVANDDDVFTPLLEDGANGIVSILNNDSDNDGFVSPTSGHIVDLDPAPGVQTIFTDPQGIWSFDAATGYVSFYPSTNFYGIANLPYGLCDSSGLCDYALITFIVNPVNDAPFVNDDTVTSVEDTPVYIPVTANDGDLESPIDPTSILITVPPTNGTVVFDPVTGVITYTPNPNFCGIDSFVYQACDSGEPLPAACDTATVTLTINCINNAPVLVDAPISTFENTPISGDLIINGIDDDVDGTPLVVNTIPISGPMIGASITIQPDGTYTYTPAPGFVGTDVVTVQVCDSGFPLPVLCGTKMLTIQVVNAASSVPIANDDYASSTFFATGNVGTISILQNDLDIDGNPSPTSGHTIDLDLTTAGVQNTITTSDGTWVYDGSTGIVTFNFNIGFHGVAMLTYQLCDSSGFCDTAEIVFAVPLSSSLIFLNAFLDSNANGIRDAGEPNFYQGDFQYELNDDGIMHYLTSNSIGVINDSVTTNSYDFSFVINSNFTSQYSCSTSYTNVSPSNSGTQILNFPVTSSTTYFEDVIVYLVPGWSSPRPGFYYENYVILRNNGNQTIASGNLNFTKDASVTITSVSPVMVLTPSGFTYNFTNLLPFETRFIYVVMLVPTIPTVAIGQQLTNSVTVDALPSETYTINNSSSITQTIVGAYDPNDKTEHHGGPIVHSTFTNEDYLTYTIRFENTGTANAEFVKVEDTLDAKLDENSLEMIDSDHIYTLERTGNALVWRFYDINLPPSVPDSSIGHGYITFKIKPKPGYAVGDIIENTAQIYFDTNPAIVTNTYQTEFVTTLHIDDFSSNNLRVYPNPVEDIVQLSFNNSDEKKVEVFNCLGVLLTTKTASSDFISFDVSSYASGVYFVKCSVGDKVETVKVVKK